MKFSDQVKLARTKLGYSQMKFAEELNVSFSSINRWENGHTVPPKIFITAFTDYCKKHRINLEEDMEEKDNELKKCDWCEAEYEMSELKDTNQGALCFKCIKAIKSRGEKIVIKN